MKIFVSCLITSLSSLFFYNSSMAQSRPEIENRKTYIRSLDQITAQEALFRKERSIETLKKFDIPYIDHLPVVEVTANTTRRGNEEVALRAACLLMVALRGEGLEKDIVDSLVKEYGLDSALTAKEKAFLGKSHPTTHEKLQFVWRYEAYNVLLWALQFTDELGPTNEIVDVEKVARILGDLDREKFLKQAKLRPQNEIVDALDLTYRFHWAIVDARLKEENPPKILEPGIILERHYALNWLTGYFNQAWDDISTDT